MEARRSRFNQYCLFRSEVAAQRQISSRRDSLCCACGRLARLMPAGERTKRLVPRSEATRFGCLTPRLKIIRQPERLECANDIQTPEGVQRTRGVAKGTPRMTSVNQRWRAGARQQTALAGCEGMSVRHSARAPELFANGNHELLARSYLLSA